MTILLKFDQLNLDLNNPRLPDSLGTEQAIIDYMLRNEQCLNLAFDIAENGLSPIEAIAVTHQDEKYVVLEGNRRISALKILHNPNLINKPSDRKKVEKILNKFPNIQTDVHCEVFENRNKARLWIQRRHSGQQEGIGTKSWSSVQQARFQQQSNQKPKNALALAIIKMADNLNLLQDTKKLPVTTIQRFLNNPTFRNFIGLRALTNQNTLEIDIPSKIFTEIIKQFLSDISDKTINSRSNKSNIVEYGNKIYDQYLHNVERINPHIFEDSQYKTENNSHSNDGSSDSTKDSSSESNNHDMPNEGSAEFNNMGYQASQDNIKQSNQDKTDSTTQEGQASKDDADIQSQENQVNTNSSATNTYNSRDPSKRKYIFTSNFVLTAKNNLLVHIYKELKRIEVDEYPLACAMVTRVFIEKTMKLYIEKVHGSVSPRSRMDELITNVNKNLKNQLKEDENYLNLEQKSSLNNLVNLKSNQGSALSPILLGSNAHGGAYPVSNDLKTEWINIEPMIQFLVNKID